MIQDYLPIITPQATNYLTLFSPSHILNTALYNFYIQLIFLIFYFMYKDIYQYVYYLCFSTNYPYFDVENKTIQTCIKCDPSMHSTCEPKCSNTYYNIAVIKF